MEREEGVCMDNEKMDFEIEIPEPDDVSLAQREDGSHYAVDQDGNKRSLISHVIESIGTIENEFPFLLYTQLASRVYDVTMKPCGDDVEWRYELGKTPPLTSNDLRRSMGVRMSKRDVLPKVLRDAIDFLVESRLVDIIGSVDGKSIFLVRG